MDSFRLPPELWNHICLFLSPPDLANVALVSLDLLNFARRELYRNVVLNSNSCSVQSTVHLLIKDLHLCRRVRKLALITESGAWYPKYWNNITFATWFDPLIFRQMEHLHSIHISGWPAGEPLNDDAQCRAFREMLAVIYAQTRSLTSVTLDEISFSREDVDSSPSYIPKQCLFPDLKVLPKIREVTYKEPLGGAFSWSFVVPTFFFQSPSPIEYLELEFGNYASHFSTLSTLSLPRLRTLHLRNLPRRSSRAVLSFFLAHPSLRYVHLLSCDLLLERDKLNINMLPNLHTIAASPVTLSSLAEKCDSLRYIRCLYLDCDNVESLSCYRKMIEGTKGFPNLRHIGMSRPVRNGILIAEVMALFYASVELECWTGGFYFRDLYQTDSAAEVLSLFPSLARLNICEWTYPHVPPASDANMGALHALARSGRMLKKIVLYQVHLPSKEVTNVYVVDVDTGKGKGKVKGEVGGMPLGWGMARTSEHIVTLRQTYQYSDSDPYHKERRKIDYCSTDWQIETPMNA